MVCWFCKGNKETELFDPQPFLVSPALSVKYSPRSSRWINDDQSHFLHYHENRYPF